VSDGREPLPLTVVVLAAGRGTRMRSRRPKVLHTLAGRTLLDWVLETARSLAPKRIVLVHPPASDWVPENVPGLVGVVQPEPRGSGDAVRFALQETAPDDRVLVLYGDVPLVAREDLEHLLADAPNGGLALLTARPADPRGYGRVLRDADGRLRAVREERDLGPARAAALPEVNTGVMTARAQALARWLRDLRPDNAPGEYYLTDVVARAAAEGAPVLGIEAQDGEGVLGANDARDLARLEAVVRRRRAEALLDAGVRLIDPLRVDVRGTIVAGRDVVLDVDVILEGRVELGDGVHVGAFSYLRNVTAAPGAVIRPYSHLEDACLGAGSRVGPYARLRDGVTLAEDVRVGNFVEIKKTAVGDGSKIAHLSYVGDARIGRNVNLGAGVVTVNYDGAAKHPTVVEDDAFVGCGSQLVAPITVGAGSYVGAGSTLTEDTPPGELTLARARQVTIRGWRRPGRR
jgi:bifunctional UDP-N-acetylglucosamine pyrophosphorylase/glucosamine-1-phosphate N-acetyltransferase